MNGIKNKIVQVNFKETGETEFNVGIYSFQCKYQDVKVGDIVICDTRYGPNIGLVTKVVSINHLERNANILPRREVIEITKVNEFYQQKTTAKNRLAELENKINSSDKKIDNINKKILNSQKKLKELNDLSKQLELGLEI